MSGSERLLRIGTRGSPLALWQAEWIGSALKASCASLSYEILKIRTLAEKFPEQEPAEIGVGIFTRELDEALLRGDIDIAVHSLKDVPSEIDPELVMAAIPPRESALDAWISTDGTPLEKLPRGARIGTGSPRRKAQLLHHRRDLEIVPLRGNVATRLRKMTEQGLSGTILAHAGLKRLGEEARVTQILAPEVLVPAVSQGALCVMARADRSEIVSIASRLEHAASRVAITAERGFLRSLRGGCLVPAGALATLDGLSGLTITGAVAATDGSSLVRGTLSGPQDQCEDLGARLAEQILKQGGAAILEKLGRH